MNRIFLFLILFLPFIYTSAQTPDNGCENEATYTWVPLMPDYPGGTPELAKFIRANLHYPDSAQQNRVQGKIMVRFLVSREGTIDSACVMPGTRLGYGCEEEALRVIKAMPRWMPGKQNGKAVAVWFTVPIVFKYEEVEKK